MTLSEVRGQTSAVETLTRALERGKPHHAYRFEGADGVGKELAAFGLAQALVCTEGRGCGACNACRRAVTLSETEPRVPLHPDVILIERGLYADVLRDGAGKKLEEKAGISIEQVRRIVLAQVGFAPAEGRARVFIVRDAHDLTTSAANALLKTLEEPRPSTHFVLLTSRPDKLLPTIRSRSMPIRFGPLPEPVVTDLLVARGVARDVAEIAASFSDGSVATALQSIDPELAKGRAAFVSAAIEAAATRNIAKVLSFAERADSDRGRARAELLGLATHLGRLAKRASPIDAHRAGALARGYDAVLAAADDLETANASPLLTLTRLLVALGRTGAASAALLHGES